jgi:hypothetical protein
MRDRGNEREAGYFVEQKIRYSFPCLLELQDILIIICKSFANVVAERQWLLLRHCLSCHIIDARILRVGQTLSCMVYLEEVERD